MYINNPGHMTKMAIMPPYGKNPSKVPRINFNKTWHVALWKRVQNVCINYVPVMTLTYFTARSALVVYAVNCENVIEGKNFQEIGKWTEYL